MYNYQNATDWWSNEREGCTMGIVVSMLMIAVGAVMRFAGTAEGRGFNVASAGVVLMVVGVIGALLSIGFWASWGGFNRGRGNTVITTTPGVTNTPPVVTGERTTVTERELR